MKPKELMQLTSCSQIDPPRDTDQHSHHASYFPFLAQPRCYREIVLRLLSSANSTVVVRKKFYSRQHSGHQTVVTRRYIPFSHPYVPSFLSRIGFGIPAFQPFMLPRRFSLNFATHALALSAHRFLPKKNPHGREDALGET